MKLFSKAAAFVACAGLAFSLVGCQSGEKKPAEPTDTQLMKESHSTTPEVQSPFYVLIVGNDSRTGTIEITKESYSDGTGRSDTMMLARIDPTTYAVTLITIPRDTTATYDGSTIKINEAYHKGGIDAAMEQVTELTGVTPKYYLDMGFVEFEQFVDELGGVTASVPINMQLEDIVSGGRIELAQGDQDLNGAEALVLARSRKQYADNLDACRQIQDRQLVEVAIKAVAADPANAAAHVNTLLGNVETNWPTDELVSVVTDFAAHADEFQIVSGTGPYAGGVDNEAGGQWLATRDEETWSKIIETVEAGGDPKTIVALPEVFAL